MRLTQFRVTNFRSVVDSGWIEAEQVTALIGVNESGKTNLLLPLWKLNPAREGEIRPTSDYPKAKFGMIREAPNSFAFIHADFELQEGQANDIASLAGEAPEVLRTVRVSRFFNGGFIVRFPDYVRTTTIASADATTIVRSAHDEIAGMSPLAKEGSLKDDVLGQLSLTVSEMDAIPQLDENALAGYRATISHLIPEAPAATSSISPRLNLLLEQIDSMIKMITRPEPGANKKVRDYVLSHLPKFVFYSNYGNLDSEIYLPHVVDNLDRDDLGAKEAAKARTLRVLFNFVRLQPKEILELGRDFSDPQHRRPTADEIAEIAEQKRERTILLHSAGTDLTKKFGDWWKQGDYTFEFQADGDHFRIWVSDKRRPEKVELEDRSSGLQWFLSFYLIFLVESSGEHADAILLLDEPGLSLHPLAQRDLSAFFENLARTNQLIYTTHSPFLVDADMLDRVRKVYVAEDGSTKASTDLRRGSDDPRKAGATYAIYSALNMSMAESILYGCDPVIVEGPSDQHYLTAIKTVLIGADRINPKREIVFPPCHGASNAKVIAGILGGKEGVLPSMLLDGDPAGQKMARDLQNGLYKDAKNKVKITANYVPFADSEIEDLIPVEILVPAVDRWGRKADNPFADVVTKGAPIVPQIESWAGTERLDLYDGWKVDLSREIKRRILDAPSKIEEATLDLWARIFRELVVDC